MGQTSKSGSPRSPVVLPLLERGMGLDSSQSSVSEVNYNFVFLTACKKSCIQQWSWEQVQW